MKPRARVNAVIGALLLAITVLIALSEWRGEAIYAYGAAGAEIILLSIFAARVHWTRRIFILIGLALFAAAALTRPDWSALTLAALKSGAFIAAFFSALATLRTASAGAAAIQDCGRFLARQPPGRRYAALAVGGHLFALLLSYGAIALLGGLAESSARSELNEEIRIHRTRRMLLAIQRGFISSLTWSPLTFAVVISISLVPGAKWANAVGPCLVSALILSLVGWALDTIFKPRLSTAPPPRAKVEGGWVRLWPLLTLLVLLVLIVGGLHLATGVRSVGVVILVAPLFSFGWVGIQYAGRQPLQRAFTQAGEFLTDELPSYQSELTLLIMAGFIGSLGSALLAPLAAAAGLDLSSLPAWEILVALVWIIPLAGQLGMNPILAVSLIAPMLPTPVEMGVHPSAVVVSVTAGWALSGASSPYTATTMLVGAISRVSALRVGLGWNGVYTLICAAALSLWVVLVAAF